MRLLLTASFLSLLVCIFLIVSTEIQSFCWGFLLPIISLHVVFTASLMWLHWLLMSTPSSSSYSSCRTLNILANATLYSSAVLGSFRKSTLYLAFCLSCSTPFVLSLSFSLAVTRWWSDATSAPLFTRTSCSDLLNICHQSSWNVMPRVQVCYKGSKDTCRSRESLTGGKICFAEFHIW